MKNKELFDRTIAVLVKAYQRGDLNAFNCAACAVGNLVANGSDLTVVWDSSGATFKSPYDHRLLHPSFWRIVLYNGNIRFHQENHPGFPDLYNIGRKFLDSTGYTDEQLIAIEKAFIMACDKAVKENTPYGELMLPGSDSYKTEPVQYAGLMAVVDVLMEIHEATEEQTREAKEQFVKV